MSKDNLFRININEYISSIVQDESLFYGCIEYQAELLGIKPKELLEVLDAKVKEFLNSSNFAIRISHRNLSKVLLNGYFLNQYESKASDGGIYTPSYRKKIERDVLNIPLLLDDEDRPIYGMCIPNDDSVGEYIENGPGSFLGANDGCLVVLNRDISPSTTFTLGDSLANYEYLRTAPVASPFFNGIYPDFYDKFSSINELKEASLSDIFDVNNNYLELQIHGRSNHSASIIDYVVFTKEPDEDLVSSLRSLNIPYVIAPPKEHTNKK